MFGEIRADRIGKAGDRDLVLLYGDVGHKALLNPSGYGIQLL